MTITYYRKPDILARPELEKGHVIIEASAGTGKTFTLEHLVLDLIINHTAGVEEILVVTFTDAATRELRERVRALIQRVRDESSETEPACSPELYWKIDEKTRVRLNEALFRFDGASISTIHGFCHGVLTEQAFLSGRLFEQQHADGREIFGLAFREELRVVLAETGPDGEALRRWLTNENKLSSLEVFLYGCHREGFPDRTKVTPAWDPDRFLDTLSKIPAAAELKKAGSEVFSHTRTLNAYNSIIDRLFEVVEACSSASLSLDRSLPFQQWIKESKPRTLDGVSDKEIGHLIRLGQADQAPGALAGLSAILSELESQGSTLESYLIYQFLPRVQTRLSARKRLLGLLDYDDMLLGVYKALSGAGSRVLIEALRRRWKYALVDEFQDTDPVQWAIFRRIFVDQAPHHRLFVIGDPKQAIYGFRGADLHTYDQARTYLISHVNASRLPLVYNFRSSAAMIDAVNEIFLIKNSAGAGYFSGLNRYEEPVECGDPERRAEEEGLPLAPVQLLHLSCESGPLKKEALTEGLAVFIASEIRRLTDPRCGLVTAARDREPAAIKLNDIFILTRTFAEGQRIGKVLRRYGINHAFYKQDGLFQTEEASNVYRLLRAISLPGQPEARLQAWLTPFFSIPLAELSAWRDAPESYPQVALFLKWKQLADRQAWSRFFDALVTDSGIVRRLIFTGDERALTNYLHLLELLQAEAHARPLTLRELVRDLKAKIDERGQQEGRESNIQRLETDKDAVQIMTMHKAKGLEAEVVFLGGGFGNPPSGGLKTEIYHIDNRRYLHIGNAAGAIADLIRAERRQENERLIYVALTRAKSKLYLPYFGPAPEATPAERHYGYRYLGEMYSALQRQLETLASTGKFNNQQLYQVREVICGGSPGSDEPAEKPDDLWCEPGLLEQPISKAVEAKGLEAAHRGIIVTSYTRMKSGISSSAKGDEAGNPEALRSEEVAAESEVVNPSPAALELPGGKETGIFLHALLEDIPFAEIRGLSFELWTELDSVQKRTAVIARRHGFAREYLPLALQLIYNALTTPLKVESADKKGSFNLPGGIVEAGRVQAEMAFAYPIPEQFHPLLSAEGNGREQADGATYQALRGYLQGLIDLVFEIDGKIFLLDWKSDYLPDYSENSIASHVEVNYMLQARIYTLAVIRLLGIENESSYEENFGGILYLFIRGLEAEENGSRGVWFSKPAWADLLTWEKNLVTQRHWGGAVIE